METIIIFGGSGFIGTHLSQYLLSNELVEKIYCVDIVKPRFASPKVEFIHHDIREPFNSGVNGIRTIYNFAAVHVTPGHPDKEFFETNIKGAQNVCDFAEKENINRMVFTSSIAIYQSSEDLKIESDLPQPASAYGISKLVGEYINRCWAAKNDERKLVIVRPAAVFGLGEGDNFTRLYQGLEKKYFFYPGRKDARKGWIYVKDLARVLYEMSEKGERFQLYNMCYSEVPTTEDIVKTMAEVTGVSEARIVVPSAVLKFCALFLMGIFKIANKKIDIHPERVKKLMTSTNVSGEKLKNSPYELRYTLKEAVEDWYNDCDKKGLF